jgi:hypothetical protein
MVTPRILRTCYEETSCAPVAVIFVNAAPGRTTRAPSAPASSSFAHWRAHEPPVANARCARPAGTAHPAARTFGLTDDEPAEAHALPAIAAHGVRAAGSSARKGARPSDRCPQLQDRRHACAMAHPDEFCYGGVIARRTLCSEPAKGTEREVSLVHHWEGVSGACGVRCRCVAADLRK